MEDFVFSFFKLLMLIIHFRRCLGNPRVAVFCFEVTETRGSCLYRKRSPETQGPHLKGRKQGCHFQPWHHARRHAFCLPINSIRMDKSPKDHSVCVCVCAPFRRQRNSRHMSLMTLVSDKENEKDLPAGTAWSPTPLTFQFDWVALRASDSISVWSGLIQELGLKQRLPRLFLCRGLKKKPT